MNTGNSNSPRSPDGFAFTKGERTHNHIYNPSYSMGVVHLTWDIANERTKMVVSEIIQSELG